MKNQIYKELKILLCALSTSILVTGCVKDSSKSSISSKELQTKSVEQTKNDQTDSLVSVDIPSTEEVATTSETISKDEQVIEYLNHINESIDECVDTVSSKVKSGFITIVDFLFYDGEICHVTFDELEGSTKEKVLDMSNDVMIKLDTKFPNFRASVSEKYKQASTFLIEKKDQLISIVKEKLGDEKSNKISEYYGNTKGRVSDTYDRAKEKVKNWYEEFREN